MRNIRNVPVAVIGGAGFLGSHLTTHLLEDRGCKVLVIDNLCAGRREFIHPDATFIHHDITGSEEFLRRMFRENKIQFVFNYAAWPYIVDSFSRPLHVFDVNCTGAIKVINAAQEAGCESILQVSSAEVYGEPVDAERMGLKEYRTGKITEDGCVIPHSSYGAAKAAIDAWAQVRWREAKTPVIALRQFNAVGERETHPYVVPEIISQLARQKWRTETGDMDHAAIYRGQLLPSFAVAHNLGASLTGIVHLGNNSFRDFIYAGDAVRIAVELLEKGELGEVYNLGNETGIKIYDLAKLIGELMGFADVSVVEDEKRKRPWEIWHLCACCDKLYSVVKNRSRMTLGSALRQTILWYEENGRKWCWE